MIRAVVFDVGNVLIRWEPRRVFPEMSEGEVERLFAEIGFSEWNREQDRGRSWAEGVAVLAARHPRRAEEIARFAEDWHRAVPEAVPGTLALLDALRARAVPTHAITNFSAERWVECCARFPFLADRFGVTIVSAHERLVKPDPRIYRRLLERTGLAAADCLFIDDAPANIAAAETLGMAGHLFEGAEGLARDLRERGLIA